MEIARTKKASFLRDSVQNLVVDFISIEDTRAVLYMCQSIENFHVLTTASPRLHSAGPKLDT
ncbi:hypothetical protein C8R44DRAFT_985094, partial [Mycena epipterygia]